MPGVDDEGDAAVVTLLVAEPLPGVLAVAGTLLFKELLVLDVVVLVLSAAVAGEPPLLITGELRLPNNDLLGDDFTGVSGVSKSGSNGSLTTSLSPFVFTENCPS